MKVVNLRKEKFTNYIGRGSIFGNPYKIGVDGDRLGIINLFEGYARITPKLLLAIGNLPEDAILGCFCKPKPCHGDIMIKLWRELHGN